MTVQAGEGAADQRREQMLRAALEVIAERGFAETRIADVAERVAVSSGLVIYYFKTKDQLLTDAIRYAENGWHEAGQRRVAKIPTAAGRLEEIVAMNCLPEADPETYGSWLPWLDFWALAARNPETADVRRKSDARWRETICELVLQGQKAGEFSELDAFDFAITLSAMLDGLAIQIALEDPTVDENRAFQLCMRFVAAQLGLRWNGTRSGQQAPD